MKGIEDTIEVNPDNVERRRAVRKSLEFRVVEGGEVRGVGGAHLAHLGDTGVGEL
jgi:hypothetical protein